MLIRTHCFGVGKCGSFSRVLRHWTENICLKSCQPTMLCSPHQEYSFITPRHEPTRPTNCVQNTRLCRIAPYSGCSCPWPSHLGLDTRDPQHKRVGLGSAKILLNMLGFWISMLSCSWSGHVLVWILSSSIPGWSCSITRWNWPTAQISIYNFEHHKHMGRVLNPPRHQGAFFVALASAKRRTRLFLGMAEVRWCALCRVTAVAACTRAMNIFHELVHRWLHCSWSQLRSGNGPLKFRFILNHCHLTY